MTIPLPLNDTIVVVEEVDEDLIVESNILLPEDRRKATPRKGQVVAVGPGKLMPDYTYAKMGVSVGDTVYFGRLNGTVITYAGTEYTILPVNFVLAVIEVDNVTT